MTTTPGTPIAVALHGAEPAHVEPFYKALLGWTIQTATGGTATAVGEDGVSIATVVPGQGSARWIVTLQAPVDPEDRITAGAGQVRSVDSGTIYALDPAGATLAAADAWFEIMTDDSAGADQFYSRVFGLSVQPTRGDDDYALLVGDRGPVAGRLGLPPGLDQTLGVRWMTYLAHPDVDSAAEQVTTLGGGVLVPPRTPPQAASPR